MLLFAWLTASVALVERNALSFGSGTNAGVNAHTILPCRGAKRRAALAAAARPEDHSGQSQGLARVCEQPVRQVLQLQPLEISYLPLAPFGDSGRFRCSRCFCSREHAFIVLKTPETAVVVDLSSTGVRNVVGGACLPGCLVVRRFHVAFSCASQVRVNGVPIPNSKGVVFESVDAIVASGAGREVGNGDVISFGGCEWKYRHATSRFCLNPLLSHHLLSNATMYMGTAVVCAAACGLFPWSCATPGCPRRRRRSCVATWTR